MEKGHSEAPRWPHVRGIAGHWAALTAVARPASHVAPPPETASLRGPQMIRI